MKRAALCFLKKERSIIRAHGLKALKAVFAHRAGRTCCLLFSGHFVFEKIGQQARVDGGLAVEEIWHVEVFNQKISCRQRPLPTLIDR